LNRLIKLNVVSEVNRRKVALIVLLCFFASGASGLIYQVVWVRELVLVFGATTFATSTVLTAFMCGLAFGSFLFGRLSARIRSPLKLYGLLEVSIGIYGLAVPIIFAALPYLYQPLWRRLQLSFLALSAIRFVLAVLVLILPTTLMGATLPVLAIYYAQEGNRIGLRVGLLYSLNTFGAVIGAAGGGFVLMPAIGMRATTITAATINIALGLTALWLAKNSSPFAIYAKPADRKTAGEIIKLPIGKQGDKGYATKAIVLVAFALSGFAALCYEVIWSRVLALIIGSSVYAFSIMLATFLTGLAVGAILAARAADQIARPTSILAAIEIAIGISSLIGAYFFNELPYVFLQLYKLIADSHFGFLLLGQFLVASLVMIVPTLLLGSLFPLVVRTLAASRLNASSQAERHRLLGTGSVSGAVGNAYAANTVGAIVGAFASGFVLIPWLGLLGSLRLSVAVNIIIAAALFVAGRYTLKAAATAALVILVILINPPWDTAVMSSAVYRYAPSMSKLSRQELFDYLQRGQGETVFYKEGITSTVAVQRQAGGAVLKVNGKPEASTAGDLPTQVLIGTLPLLVREKTETVLVIGLGSGVTLGSVEQFPIKQVTCVELEPAVVEASHYFDQINNRPLDDPRLRLIANDGRNFIDTTGEKFDVIISEPSNPWLTGVANLFTLEYFKHGAERLKDDGIFSQWLQIYEMQLEDLKAMVATFHAAFPHVYVFRGAEGDLMLLGGKRPIRLNLPVISSHLADKKIAADHMRIQTSSAADLISRFYFGTQEVKKFCAGAQLNTDDNALIEFNAPRRVGTSDETVQRNLAALLEYATSPVPYFGGESFGDPEDARQSIYANGRGPRDTAEFLLDVSLGAIKHGDLTRAEDFCNYSIELADSARAHSIIGEIKLARGDARRALDQWRLALEMDEHHYYTLINLGKFYLMNQQIAEAAAYLDRAIQVQPDSARAHHLRGLAYQAWGDNARAVMEYRKALPDRGYARSTKTFYLNFGTALASLGLYQEAAQMLEEYAELSPQDPEAHYQLGAVYEVLAEREPSDVNTYRARDELRRVIQMQPQLAMAHYYLSKVYRRLGLEEEADREFQTYERLQASKNPIGK
jgi:spermidine synthase